MLAENAEALTGITHQQVTKWSKRLADRDAYRERLYGAVFRGAWIFGARRIAAENTGGPWGSPAMLVHYP